MIRDQFTGVRPAQLNDNLRDERQRLILFKALRFSVQIIKAGEAQAPPAFLRLDAR